MLIYYRGQELITAEDKELLLKVWGESPYHHFKELPIDHNSGSGIHFVTEVMLTIQNERDLNYRDQKIRERIESKKGKLTHSTAYHSDYVERNIVHALVLAGIYRLKHETGIEIKSYEIPWEEFYRLYNLPKRRQCVMEQVRKSEARIHVLPETKANFKFKKHYESQSDCDSSYQEHFIKLDGCHYNINLDSPTAKDVYRKFPFVGKIHACDDSNGYYLQVYLYDFANSENALNTVLNYLNEKHITFA